MCHKMKKLFFTTFFITAFVLSAANTVRNKRQNSTADISTTVTTELRPSNSSSSSSDGYTGSNYTSSQNDLKADENGKFMVKIGHIGAMGILPNDEQILNISRLELIEEGLLGKDFDFQ